MNVKHNILPALECFDELAVGHYYHSCLITTGIIARQTVKYNCATKVCKKKQERKEKKVFVQIVYFFHGKLQPKNTCEKKKQTVNVVLHTCFQKTFNAAKPWGWSNIYILYRNVK